MLIKHGDIDHMQALHVVEVIKEDGAPDVKYFVRNSTRQPNSPMTGHCPHCKENVRTVMTAEIGSYAKFKLCLWTFACCGLGLVCLACDVGCCRCLSKDDVAQRGFLGDTCNCIPHDYVHTCPKCQGPCGRHTASRAASNDRTVNKGYRTSF